MQFKSLVQRVVLAALALASGSATAIQQQQGMNWCWAASLQEVLADRGIRTSQPEIAARLSGWPMDRPAHIGELTWLAQSYGLQAWRAGRPANPVELASTLHSGSQVIAFVMPSNGPVGHFVVLKGLDRSGLVYVADPAYGRTFTVPVHVLYQQLRWMDAVVVH